MKHNARALAATILTEAITNKQPLNHIIAKHRTAMLDDAAFVQALCYGVMRFYLQLDFIANLLLSKPLPAKSALVKNLLLVGLFQLQHMRVPDHAAIFETVAAAKQLKQLWAVKLINGLLRNFQRQQTTLLQQVAKDLVASTTHPKWLLQALQTAWPQHSEAIIATNNSLPPVAIRVNLNYCDLATAIEFFQQQDMPATPIADTNAGLIVDTTVDLTLLPEFAAGMFFIQDGAAQLAAQLLDLQPGQLVLDACAAPGGKTCNMLELEPTIQLLALDNSATRSELIMQNITRLKLPVPQIKIADAALVTSWWDNNLFDRILLDAPCSATGIIRRQPDIKLFRTTTEIANLTKQQQQLLNNLWPLLKPGGILLYATCSVLPQENEQLLSKFIAEHRDALVIPCQLTTGCTLPIGQQILPGQHNMDGFYYAKLQKAAK